MVSRLVFASVALLVISEKDIEHTLPEATVDTVFKIRSILVFEQKDPNFIELQYMTNFSSFLYTFLIKIVL